MNLLRRWLGVRLRQDWTWDQSCQRPTLVLTRPPWPGWYLLSVVQHSDQLRCFGLLNGCQGRLLVNGKLRRRLVRIRPGTRRLRFELHGLKGNASVSVLRLVPQGRGRALRLLARKLTRLYPGYDGANLPKRSLVRQWRDYNRLLSRHSWPLIGYDEWIERIELPQLAANPTIPTLEPVQPLGASPAAQASLRFAPGLWGDDPGDHNPSSLSSSLSSSLASFEQQQPGDFQRLAADEPVPEQDSSVWYVMLKAGDRLAPQALRRFQAALALHPDAQVVYADEDRITAEGRRHSPQFKPAWNPDLLYSDPHYSHCWLIRADLAHRACWALERAGESISLYGMVLEATAACPSDQILHLPEVLYHRLDQPGERRGDRSSAATLESFLARHGQEVKVRPRSGGGHRLQWALPNPAPLVSVIIPTRDRADLLRCCITSLEEHGLGNPPLELLVVDNGSSEPDTLAYLDQLERHGQARVLRRPGPFNYAALNNGAAALARGELLAFLNNDVEAVHPGWLASMAAEALRPEIGAVGARLLFEDGTVQHAGVLLGIGGVAGHAHKYLEADAQGYQLRLQLAQNVSAVTAAALVIRRGLFEQVGGFDADNFAVNYNDVDLCLRLMVLGYRNLYCPDAVLVHHESRTRGVPSGDDSQTLQWWHERQLMQRRWGAALTADPHYSPHLSLVEENLSLALRPPAFAPRRSALRPPEPC